MAILLLNTTNIRDTKHTVAQLHNCTTCIYFHSQLRQLYVMPGDECDDAISLLKNSACTFILILILVLTPPFLSIFLRISPQPQRTLSFLTKGFISIF